MEKCKLIQYITLIGILVVSILVSALTTRGRVDLSLPVEPVLPDKLDEYAGEDVFHCQNESCLKTFFSAELRNGTSCPVCGGELDTVSLAEHQLLPKDTKILHRMYKANTGKSFYVSVVIGGAERRSIHKPQVCLVAQGNSITRQYAIKVPISGHEPLDVMLMELNDSRMVYAYWFTNGEKTTSSHLARLFWVAWDGIVHNKRKRWAYISVSLPVQRNIKSTINILDELLADLYVSVSCGQMTSD